MTKDEENSLVLVANREMAIDSGVQELMLQIRPEWQAKLLVKRVTKLLPVDPSSACQKLFNAAVHDLKKKIMVAGLDIAKEAASSNRLPEINRPENIKDYSVSKTLDLAYYMGLLSRPEWRRITRVYDIRRDLEHEDDEYEATIEDCFYIFKTCIEAVLAKDPIEVIRLTDIKDIVEQPSAVTLDYTVREEYEIAPAVRQVQIYKFLISTALSDKHPDIVRENCYICLGELAKLTKDKVKIEVSQFYSDKVKRSGLDVFTARVSFAAGILPYFKKSILMTFYDGYMRHMKAIGHDFRNNNRHGKLLRELREFGGLECCPYEVASGMIEWLCHCYIGEKSFGYYSSSRPVFYSNVGAPLAKEILLDSKHKVSSLIDEVIKESRPIQEDCKWKDCKKRAQDLIDAMA
jgi:DNA-binding MltR family transcriptional regulator